MGWYQEPNEGGGNHGVGNKLKMKKTNKKQKREN
jgi:hypothetical protein